MKPVSVFLTILLGAISLSFVVWIGRFNGAIPKLPETKGEVRTESADEVPIPKSGPYGKAEIEETTFNFGTKLVGTNSEHTFTVKNVGDGDLKFKLGKPTCQCTGVEVSKPDGELYPNGEGSIPPGQSVNVLIKWQMKAKMEKFRHGAPLHVSDPAQRKIELYVTGAVDGPFDLRPGPIWQVGEIQPFQSAKAVGSLTSKVCDEFTLEREPRENSHVEVTFEALSPEELTAEGVKSGYKITCEVNPNIPVGAFTEVVSVKAIAKGIEDFHMNLDVLGRRSGPIEIRGTTGGAGFQMGSNRLVFQDFLAAQGKTVNMTMFVKGSDDDLVLQGIEPSDSPYTVTLANGKVLGKSKSYQMTVVIPPGPPGFHRGNDAVTLNLKLNHPDAPEFKLVLDYNSIR